jgi:hypothetical protein
MARPKGSLNKKNQHVKSEFEDVNKEFNNKTEVDMSPEVAQSEVELETIQQELDLARVELEKTRLEIETRKHELKEIINIPVQVKPAESPSITIKNDAAKEKIAAQKARDSVMVTGKFYNLRVKGQSVKLPYQKYGDEPVKWHPFDHGKVYTIPKGFADQINGGTESDPMYYTPHFVKNEGIILDPDDPDTGIHAIDTTDKKFSFVPLNF